MNSTATDASPRQQNAHRTHCILCGDAGCTSMAPIIERSRKSSRGLTLDATELYEAGVEGAHEFFGDHHEAPNADIIEDDMRRTLRFEGWNTDYCARTIAKRIAREFSA